MGREITKIKIIQTTWNNLEKAQEAHEKDISDFLYNQILKLKDVQINTSYEKIYDSKVNFIPLPAAFTFESIIHYPKIIN